MSRGIIAIEDDRHLDRGIDRAIKVIRIAAGDIPVHGGLAAPVAGIEHLEDIPLATAGLPARTLGAAILERVGDLRVEDPRRGHVLVPARGAGDGHVELEEEELLGAVEAVVGHAAGPGRAAVAALTGPVGHEDELVAVAEHLVGEDLGRGRAGLGIGGGVGERVAEELVEDAGALAAHVVEEGEAFGGLLLGAVVGLAAPLPVSGIHRGCGCFGGGLVGSLAGGAVGCCGRSGLGTASILVGPGYDFTINCGNDHVTNSAFFAADAVLLDLTGFVLIASVAVDMAILSYPVRARLDVSLPGARSWSVEGEMLEVERAAEMPGNLFKTVSQF
jgi:hypothetical protein